MKGDLGDRSSVPFLPDSPRGDSNALTRVFEGKRPLSNHNFPFAYVKVPFGFS
jgi:hypothetical protein